MEPVLAESDIQTNPKSSVSAGMRVEMLAERLHGLLSDQSALERTAPLRPKTTLRVGGVADLYLTAGSTLDLAAALRACKDLGVPWLVLGRGSNLVVRDEGVRGLVIRLHPAKFGVIRVRDCRIECGAGALLRQVATAARNHGVSKLEFLDGIPGSVGGALRMNAGAMGCAILEVTERVRLMTSAGEILEVAGRDIPAAYRDCAYLRERIALGATFSGKAADREAIRALMAEYNRRRWSTQPPQASAGCIFRNPPSIPAGRLIEELGLKGRRVGRARVSEVHGNFIVNEGGATAREVLDLIELIRRRAREERGVELELEVRVVGEE